MTKVTTINTLAVKPAHLDEFIALQREFASARAQTGTGLLGGRMYKTIEGSKAVLVSRFESLAAQSALTRSDEFSSHIAKLRALVESSSPDLYEVAYTYGAFG